MYETPEELQLKVDEYFETHDKPTISELALFLGFVDRHSFYDYEQCSKFTHTIKRARAKLVGIIEKQATYGDKQTGPIFMLKNFGYSDKIEVNQKTEETVVHKIDPKIEALLNDLRPKEELKVIDLDRIHWMPYV